MSVLRAMAGGSALTVGMEARAAGEMDSAMGHDVDRPSSARTVRTLERGCAVLMAPIRVQSMRLFSTSVGRER